MSKQSEKYSKQIKEIINKDQINSENQKNAKYQDQQWKNQMFIPKMKDVYKSLTLSTNYKLTHFLSLKFKV